MSTRIGCAGDFSSWQAVFSPLCKSVCPEVTFSPPELDNFLLSPWILHLFGDENSWKPPWPSALVISAINTSWTNCVTSDWIKLCLGKMSFKWPLTFPWHWILRLEKIPKIVEFKLCLIPTLSWVPPPGVLWTKLVSLFLFLPIPLHSLFSLSLISISLFFFFPPSPSFLLCFVFPSLNSRNMNKTHLQTIPCSPPAFGLKNQWSSDPHKQEKSLFLKNSFTFLGGRRNNVQTLVFVWTGVWFIPLLLSRVELSVFV